MGQTLLIPPYKPAKIYEGSSEWFVYFSYYCRTQKKYIRCKVRIHRRGLEMRLKNMALQEVCRELNKEISYRNSYGIFHEDVLTQSSGVSAYDPLLDCGEYFRNDKEISESSRKNLGYFLFSYKLFLKEHQCFSSITPSELNALFIKNYVRFLQQRQYTGKTINCYLSAIELITKRLVQLEELDQHFAVEPYRVRQVKNETEKYRPLTSAEKEAIFNYYRTNDPYFYLYLLCIYYTCIRPTELKRLKLSFINLDGRIIKTPWYTAKNGNSEFVQILKPLHDAFIDSGIDKISDQSLYLFGDGFKPGKEYYERVTPSDMWRRTCRKLGIDDSANMYGLKHTFNVDFVENNKYNIDWEFLRRHNRHATIQQTQAYISGLTAYFLDETKAVILNYHKTK